MTDLRHSEYRPRPTSPSPPKFDAHGSASSHAAKMRDSSSAAFLKILTSLPIGTKATSHDADWPTRWSVQSLDGCGSKGRRLMKGPSRLSLAPWRRAHVATQPGAERNRFRGAPCGCFVRSGRIVCGSEPAPSLGAPGRSPHLARRLAGGVGDRVRP